MDVLIVFVIIGEVLDYNARGELLSISVVVLQDYIFGVVMLSRVAMENYSIFEDKDVRSTLLYMIGIYTMTI